MKPVLDMPNEPDGVRERGVNIQLPLNVWQELDDIAEHQTLTNPPRQKGKRKYVRLDVIRFFLDLCIKEYWAARGGKAAAQEAARHAAGKNGKRPAK